MSDSDAQAFADYFIENQPYFLISNYLGLYATVLVVYDYFLTLPLEIESIWKAERFTGATVLFLLTRYFSLLLWGVETIETLVASQSYTFCNAMFLTFDVADTIVNGSIIAIFVLRTWAIYEKNLWVLLSLGVLGLARFAIGIVDDFVEQTTTIGPFALPLESSCFLNTGAALPHLSTSYNATTLVFDTIVLFLTLAKTLKSSREAKEANIKNSLYGLLLRDGIIYYGLIEVLIVAGICAQYIETLPYVVASTLNYSTAALRIILVNHLVLNLRQYTSSLSSPRVASGAVLDSADIEMAFNQISGGERTRLPDRPFASDGFILGNLGAPLVDFDDSSEGGSISHENELVDVKPFQSENQSTISNC